MFEPRPEISTATLLHSAMVADRPVFASAPGFGAAHHGAALVAGVDTTDAIDGLAGGLEPLNDVGGIFRSNDRDHADAAIEGARQLARFDRAASLKEGEQAGQRPTVGVDHGVRAFGQDPRDILE